MTDLRKDVLEPLESVLCDPEGKAGIRGSDADNQIIDEALDKLRAALAEPQKEFRGPVKWTPEEIADDYRGIRWIMEDGVHGRPTESDLRRWLAQNPSCQEPSLAEPQPEPVACIDPMQNPMRPSYFIAGAADEHPAEQVLRNLACWLGVGGYNAPTVDADVFHRKIVDGVEQLMKSRSAPQAQQPLTDEQIDSAVYAQCPDFDESHDGPSIDDIRAIVRALKIGVKE